VVHFHLRRYLSLQDQIAVGETKVKGDIGVLKQLAATLVHFTPDFVILPGTMAKEVEQEFCAFEVGDVGTTHEYDLR
jgi:hypothetical protein